MSRRILAERLQVMEIDADKNAVQRIKSGQRFVTEIELLALARIFDVTCEELAGKYKIIGDDGFDK